MTANSTSCSRQRTIEMLSPSTRKYVTVFTHSGLSAV
jgi:hypothetical protein